MTIISFRHGFVFVKTRKTAGTSIEADLSPRVELLAVVTPLSPPVPGHRPRNHLGPDGARLFSNHMPATAIRDRLGAGRFDAMFRFCVERDPVDKCISHFHMLRNSALHNPDGAYRLTWREYVEDGRFPIDLDKYTERRDGRRRLLVDRVLRYDRLNTDLPALMDTLGIPGFALKTRAKSDYSRNILIRRDQVTAAERRRILEAFAPTLDATGLDWEAPADDPSSQPAITR